MQTTVIHTSSQSVRKVRRVNSTSATFPVRIPQKARPDAWTVAPGVAGTATLQEAIRMRGDTGSIAANLLKLIPYATGANNGTFSVRVVAWHAITPSDQDPNNWLFVPTPVCTLACTLTSTQPGLAGTPVVAAELFCDTIVVTDGDASLVKVYSPANDTVAWAVVDFLGAPWVEVLFQITSGPTDMNALHSTL